jgi:hypothetical protein
MIWRLSEVVLLPTSILVFVAAIEVGFRLGRRHRDRSEETVTHLSTLQAALLGLLALLLGFTFAMALTRYDTRRLLVVDEANAIATAHKRALFLPSTQQEEFKRLLRTYVHVRLEFYDAGIDKERLEAAYASTSHVQNQLWTLAGAAAASDPTSVAAGLLVESTNDVIALSEKRRDALQNHVAETVVYLLLAVTVGSLGFLGYGSGLAGRRRLTSSGIFAFLVALVLITILDLDRPRRGVERIGQDSMVRLEARLESEGK